MLTIIIGVSYVLRPLFTGIKDAWVQLQTAVVVAVV